MGLLDKIKSMIGGNKGKAKDTVDKASDVVEKKVGAEHADKVEAGSEKVKDVIDKLPE